MKAVLVVLLSACSSTSSHPYTAAEYEPARDCVDPQRAIDVVKGDDTASSCDARCMVAPDTHAVYVSMKCAPYPPMFDTSGTNPLCAPALAAFARNDVCIGDAGSTNPRDGGGGDASAE